MRSNTLDALGRAVLEAVEGGRVTAETLDAELDADRAEVDDRLAQLLDNGLIREAAEEGTEDGADAYELTENGARVLDSTPLGRYDNRIDTPPHVDRTIRAFELPPDREAAVRNAFSFLRYWGDATTAEIVDAAYSEAPAGYESADRWWADCVRVRLAELPDVRAVRDHPLATAEYWIYDDTAVVERDDEDGRTVDDPMDGSVRPASARYAVERSDLADDERATARAAFAILFERERATTDELRRAVAERSPGDDATDAWTARLAERFAAIPDVERASADGDGTVWTYAPSWTDDGRA